MMKRIISFLLTLCMVLTWTGTLSGTVFAEATVYNESWDALKNLGVISFDDSQKNEEITRAEFAGIIANIIAPVAESYGSNTFGKEDIATGFTDAESVFADVPLDHEYYRAMRVVTSYGIMKGNANGSFAPDKILKYEEAVKTLVVLCGYEDEALVRGGWFTGYNIVAAKLGLALSGKAEGLFLSKSETVELFYRAFDVNVRDAKMFGEDMVYYVEGESFLSTIMKMDYVDGVVTEVENSTVTAPKSSFDDCIVVDGIRIKNISGIETNKYLGREVRAFYDKSGDVNKLLYIMYDKDEDVVIIPAENMTGYPNRNIEYTVGNSKNLRRIDISGYSIIYNGTALPTPPSDIFEFEVGDVTVIDNDAVKAVVIRDYKSMIIGAINSNDTKLYAKDSSTVLELDAQDKMVKIYDKASNGKTELKFEELDTALPITYLDGGNYAEVYVCENYKTGIIGSVYSTKNTMVIDTKTYKLTDAAATEAASFVGESIRFYEDIFGNVFKVEPAIGQIKNAGILVGISKAETFGSCRVKIFMNDGSFAEYKIANKLKVYKSDAKAATAISGAELSGTIALDDCGEYITFDTNKAGEISVIKMPLTDRTLKENGDGRTWVKEISVSLSNPYTSSTMSIGQDVYMDLDTKIYGAPKNGSEKGYGIYTYTSLTNLDILVKNKTDKIKAYYEDFEDPIADAILIPDWSKESSGIKVDEPWVVTEVVTTLNKEGEPAKEITIVNAMNTIKTVWADDVTASGKNILDEVDNMARKETAECAQTATVAIGVGDIIFVELKTGTEEIAAVSCLYDCDKQNMPGGKKGMFAAMNPGSDRFYIADTVANRTLLGQFDERYHTSYTEVLSSQTGIAPDTVQNPARYQIKSENTTEVLKQAMIANSHRAYTGGYKYMVGYVAKKATGFVYLTTQDLSVPGVEYSKTGLSSVAETTSPNAETPGDARIGIYHQEWFKYVNQNGYVLLIEYYDDKVNVRKGTPEDIMSYEDSNSDASKMLAHPGARRYYIINDYRTVE